MEKFTNPDVTKMYFLGFKEKEDDYEIVDEKTGRLNKGHYHNFIISLSEPFAETEKARLGYMGQESNTYKVKAENIASVFGVKQGEFNPMAYADWFLQPVEVLYDKRGTLKSIRRVNASPTVGKLES